MPGPLAGVRILDLSQVVSGPMAAGWLADQGAAVIKIEPPHGDPVRGLGPAKGDLSSAYIQINRGKRQMVLDLKDPAARCAVHRLIERSDVLVENFRPGVMARLGFGWEAARAINPRLIYCSITGYGPDGPYAPLRAYDPMVQATSGLAATQLSPTGEPQLIQTLIIDKVTALTAAQAITAALFARERSGEGQHVEVSMLDAALAFNWPEGMFNHGFIDAPPKLSPPYGKFSRLWTTQDGRKVVLGSFQDHEFAALCDALGRPDLKADARFNTGRARTKNIAEWGPTLGAAVAAVTAEAFMAGCIAHGAGGAVVATLDEVLTHPQVIHNGAIAEVDQGKLGRVRTARNPARFSETRTASPKRAGHRGEDTDAVFAELGLEAAATPGR
ncbi:MAG: CoA transferase [Sphingomonadaceae bacterium]|nr:CoA transferase [Sphingomonadaceae bacterium]